ncbi:putative aromatic acid transporter [Sphingobium sp. SYK-6]|uniref:MFS transporter n=1 Tax=Sphingobium sp. (strain NBRC 103272 / SYK-6) TaxID=627192 RepID=UPI0002276FE6|nr:MFS transporter [Sphingobium sp. SYK-6]BAK66294.1 putative aromatic acid transporter [Sphingobium sp. SYK-6]
MTAGQGMIATISATLDQRPVSARQITILLIVQFILMIDGLDIQLLGLVAPVILAEWGIERAAFGPALAASLLGLALGAGGGGRLGDLFGRKRVLCVATFLFGLATVVAAFAQDVTQMTIIRFISGLGFGAATPSSVALVAEWLPRRAQAKAIAFLSVGTPLGGMVGALALQLFLPMLGWRGCFVACGLLTLAVAFVVLVALPESAAYLAGKGESQRAADLLKRHAGIESIALATPASAREMPTSQARQDSMFARHYLRLNVGAWLLFFSAQLIVYAFISWMPTMLTTAGFPLAQALQAIFAFNLLSVMAALLAGFLVNALGSRMVVMSAALLAAGCILLLGLRLHGLSGLPDAATYWVVMGAVGGVGIFASTVIATGYSVIALGYSEQVRATGIGVGLMIGRSGGVIMGLIGGVLLSVANDQSWPFFAVVLFFAFTILAAALVINRHIPPLR